MPFSRLYVRGAAERGQLPEGFSGSWVGAFKGESIELRLGSVEKGFAGLIKMGDGEGFLPVSSLIQRQVVGDRIKFVAFVAFSGEISFELGLEGKALQGQVSECPSVRLRATTRRGVEGWVLFDDPLKGDAVELNDPQTDHQTDPQENVDIEEIVFRRRGDGGPDKVGEAKKLDGNWKGSFIYIHI